MMILILLLLAVGFYFLSSDRRYVLMLLVLAVIEMLALSLAYFFELPSILGYALGLLMLALGLIFLLVREDRYSRKKPKHRPIYKEHTPVNELEADLTLQQNLTEVSR